jgi:SHS family lactate transporter-like MFS transporter
MAPYFLRNLIPRKQKTEHHRSLYQAVATITLVQWGLFLTGWLAWTCDAIDFFSVSLSVTNLEHQFGKSTSQITTSITLTLLFRSFGALIFGLVSDRFGRKWPLVFNLLLIASLELGVGFVQTFPQFLALRALFGVGMGGIWGLASSTALENLPVEARGIASGMIQQGYAIGYLIAAVMNLYLVPITSWRYLFHTACAISSFAAFLRLCLPESEVFLRAKAEVKVISNEAKSKVFLREVGGMLKEHWMLCIYACLLMAGFNFMSHGSQDLYPTYMRVSKGFTSHDATVATIIGNCGAIAGGVFAGYLSQYIGRRVTIIVFVIFMGACIPLWILPTSFTTLAAGAFCVQVGVQGAWGVIPIHLAEMSPPAFRSTFPGLAYQLGNMISSASAQIEATGGAEQTVIIHGKVVPDYARVQGIFLGVVACYVIVLTILGPENHASHFEQAKTAFEEGAVDDTVVLRDMIADERHRSYTESIRIDEDKKNFV